MGIDKQVREILRDRDKLIPKREILKLIEERRSKAIGKKTRRNMKVWIKKKRGGDKNMLQDIWNWLDGKKTIIGAIVHFIVAVIGVAQTSFHFQVVPPEQLGQLEGVAMFFITFGLAHRAVSKVVTK